MTVAEVLRAAADLLEPPGAWTQGAWARDGNGRPVTALSPHATCWCALGAIRRAIGKGCTLTEAQARKALQRHARLRRAGDDAEGTIGLWNDAPHRAQDHVVAELREAAASLEKATP